MRKDSCVFDLSTKLSEGDIISDFLEVILSSPGVSGETKIFFVVTSGVFHFLFLTDFLAELGLIYIKLQHGALLIVLLRRVFRDLLKDSSPISN